MSNVALNWAFAIRIPKSADKLLLVCLANYACDQGLCWPSQAKLSADTSLDRKTVLVGLRRLREFGWIEDTGHRSGSTGQVTIWRLRIDKTPDAPRFLRSDEVTDALGGAGISQPNEPVFPGPSDNTPENTHPNFPSATPKFPATPTQISHDPHPNLGHGTIMEPPRNHHGTHNRVVADLFADPGPPAPKPSPEPAQPPVEAKAKRSKARTSCPLDWWPDEAGLTLAAKAGLNPTSEVPRFRDHHLGKGSLMADWSAAWRTWCGNQVRWAAERQQRGGNVRTVPAKPSALDTIRAAREYVHGRTYPRDGPPEPPPDDYRFQTIDADLEDYREN